MKRFVKHILPYAATVVGIITAFSVTSCSKVESNSSNEDEYRYLEAYMQTHYPDALRIGLGSYILEDTPGNGEQVQDSSYLFLRFASRNLANGTYLFYTDTDVAKQLGTYKDCNDYSDYIMHLVTSETSRGIRDVFFGGTDEDKGVTVDPMRIGGRRKAIVPSYLSSASFIYETLAEYIKNATGTYNYIYEIKFMNQVSDIWQWQVDSIERYMDKTGTRVDSVKYHEGLYYRRDTLRENARGHFEHSTHTFPEDTVIYINYIGRLLSGKVFDTTIADTAKVWGIYSDSNTYGPQSVTWNADSTAITLGSSTVIEGFSMTLWQMHPYESGRGIFTSNLGYGASGSSPTIPTYAPLIFEIDIVDKE